MGVWNETARPSDHCLAATSRYDNVFYSDESVSFTLSAFGGGSFAATLYEVRNYYGTVVTAGTISGTSLSLGVMPLGWYTLYLIRPTPAAAPWLTSGGETLFAVCRRGLKEPPTGTSRVGIGGDPMIEGFDIPAHGMTQLGPIRHRMRWDAVPTADGGLAGCVSDAQYVSTWWTTDANRPLNQMVHFAEINTVPFSAGDQTRLGDTVTQMMAVGCNWFEGANEPNNFGSTATATAGRISAYADIVHAANANAKVMGPCSIGVNGTTNLNWIRDVLVSVGSKVDVISTHNYSGGSGDLPLMRKTLDAYVAMLTSIGQHTKPRANTEWGSSFAAVYGSWEHQLQCFRTMLDIHMYEQYGMPKENNYLFYDLQHGFNSFPSFWIPNYNGERHAGPLFPLLKVWGQELFGKPFAARLNFGSEDDQWLGSRFTNPSTGESVVAVQSGGRSGTVTFSVTGASSLTKVDPWGNLTNATVAGGKIVVDVDMLPVYLRVPSGATCVPEAVDYGIEVAVIQASAASAKSAYAGSSPSNALTVSSSGTDFYGADSDIPCWWQGDFPRPTRFDRVMVMTPPPWQHAAGLLDFDVQWWDGLAWQVFATATETATTIQWTSAQIKGGCYTDSFYPRRSVFVFYRTPVETTKLRVYARSVTYGGAPSLEAFNGAGLSGGSATGQGWPQNLSLRKVGVWLSGTQDKKLATARP